ncbi:cilia- and flagella-associated protein 65-like [Erinaceus europaeus]|uniref:Cilia- and flagella-associated protein 65-like n=1 Tax=Erinaceus europaeus TaxID=9365 RepID=A0ABM3XM01_ERIEU|nr:cilia- and flagella-associated protein 65-like [Erinaceus europaeus]
MQSAVSSASRPQDSKEWVMYSASFLSASTMVVPTITGNSTAMSACSNSNGSSCSACPEVTNKCFPVKTERVKKKVFWGIKVPELLKWKGWHLGMEVSKNLVLKNLSLSTQKIKYRPPKTKFFFTVIPQPIFLSPGITFTLPIIFRPLEKKEYADQLWFEKEEGAFCVDLRATLPCHTLSCPQSLQLPACAVGDLTEAWFCLDNVGELPTFFTWETSSPFQMLPSTGLLEPSQSCRVKVTFQPTEAGILEVQATCWYGEDSKQRSSLELRAVAKCAQLLVRMKKKRPEDQDAEGAPKLLHFGRVPVGHTTVRQIQLYNPTSVSTSFRIEMAPDVLAGDRTFWCPTEQGTVCAGETKALSVFFRPESLDARTMDYLTVMPCGPASQTLLKLVGFSTGPAVTLQRSCVNFGCVNLGKRSEQPLWIENQSDSVAAFQFALDWQESVFSISPASGMLGARTRLTLYCAFRPCHPIIYFLRVACLLHHQEPVFLDLMGTCHSDSTRPALLRPQHLTWYRTHLARGLSLHPPDVLAIMLKEKKLEQDKDGALMIAAEDAEDTPALQYPLIPPMAEYFFDGTADLTIFPPPVSVEPGEVDFGDCSGSECPNPVPLCLTNHTKGKITVVWTCRDGCPFWVTPQTCDVPPLKSTALRLHFQPPHRNGLFSSQLEAFALYKVHESGEMGGRLPGHWLAVGEAGGVVKGA